MSDFNPKEFIEAMEYVGIQTLVVDEEGVSEVVAPSPFLPDTNIQYAWDATSLEHYKRCPRLYFYKNIEGWRSKEDNAHLRFGQEFHQALHEYELHKVAGNGHEDCVFQVVKDLLLRTEDWEPEGKAAKYKNRPFLIRSVIKYLDKFQDDPAKTVILQNGKPAVEINFRFELKHGPVEDQPYVLCGYLDRVVEFQDQLFIMDRKTTTSTPTDYYWSQFEPNNQMTLYTLAGKVIFQTTIKGVIIESGQIMMEDTRFTRGITYRTQEQLEEWLTDLDTWLDRAAISAEYNDWPMNDTACDKYGGCEFRGICSKSPSVRDKFLNGEFTREERWNPLKPR